MDNRSVGSQVKSGIVLAGNVILVILIAGLLLSGLGLIFFPNRMRVGPFATSHPIVSGAVRLGAALVVLSATVSRWVRILPGILAYAVLGGGIALATGHLSNSSLRVPKLYVVAFIFISVIGAVACASFANRSLTMLDRLCLILFVVSFAFATLTNTAVAFIGPGVGTCALLLAWVVRQLRTRESQD